MIEKLRIRISQIFVALLITLLAISSSAWDDRMPLIGAILFCAGCVLAGIASLGRLWCSLYIAGYKTDKLITEGPYSMCRNPLYFFSFLGAIGVALASETLLVPLIVLVAFSLYYPFVIKSEEAQLRKLHKDKLTRYLDSVPKFFPKLSYLSEPEEYTVKPIIFKKHIFSAIWFIWVLGIMRLINGLHDINILPVMFKIY